MIKNKTISSNEFIIFKKSLIFYLLLSAEEKINIKILFEECKKRMNSFVGKKKSSSIFNFNIKT